MCNTCFSAVWKPSLAGASKGDLNPGGVLSSSQLTAPGVINDGLGGDRHTGTQGSHQPHLVTHPHCEEPAWAWQLPPGQACGFVKHHCYFNKLLRARVWLTHLLLILGYVGERKLGNYMTGNIDM